MQSWFNPSSAQKVSIILLFCVLMFYLRKDNFFENVCKVKGLINVVAAMLLFLLLFNYIFYNHDKIIRILATKSSCNLLFNYVLIL